MFGKSKKKHTLTHTRNPFIETWIQSHWRPLAAMVYLAICVFDFIIMPVLMQWLHPAISPVDLADLAAKITSPGAQTALITVLANEDVWHPLTLQGGGLFHLAFGALLTGAAVTRGMTQTAMVQTYGQNPGLFTAVTTTDTTSIKPQKPPEKKPNVDNPDA